MLREYARASAPDEARRDARWAAIAAATGTGAPTVASANGGSAVSARAATAKLGMGMKIGLAVALLALFGAGGWWTTTRDGQRTSAGIVTAPPPRTPARQTLAAADPTARPAQRPSQPSADQEEPSSGTGAQSSTTEADPSRAIETPRSHARPDHSQTTARRRSRIETAPPEQALPTAPASTVASSTQAQGSAGTLARELALIGEAQRALSAGDAARALGVLAAHAREFPHGALTNERDVARIGALCVAGRDGEARAAAAALAHGAPMSGPTTRALSRCAASTVRP